MGNTIAVVVAVLFVAVAGWWFWRWRKRRRHRLISLVALLREPVALDAAVVARMASRAWKVDLGDGSSEGADGFVAGESPLIMISHDQQMYLVNSFPNPYVNDPAAAAESIVDLRIRKPFAEHQAWFSFDALGIDGGTPPEVVTDLYRRIALLFVEFLDERCLLIYLPDTQLAYPISDEAKAALAAPDPITALQETAYVPVIHVSDDDPLMKQAVAKARETWPRFVAAYETQAGSGFSIKAPVSHGDVTEFIWLEVTAIEGGQVLGKLANDPADLGPLKLGSKVRVSVADLNDWGYLDARGNMQGGFTIEAVQQAARRQSS